MVPKFILFVRNEVFFICKYPIYAMRVIFSIFEFCYIIS